MAGQEEKYSGANVGSQFLLINMAGLFPYAYIWEKIDNRYTCLSL